MWTYANLVPGAEMKNGSAGGVWLALSLVLMLGQAIWLPIGLVVLFLAKRPLSAGGIIAAAGTSVIVFFGMCFGGLFQGLNSYHPR